MKILRFLKVPFIIPIRKKEQSTIGPSTTHTEEVHPFDRISHDEWMKQFNIGKQYSRFKPNETTN